MLRIAFGIALVAGFCAPAKACWTMLAPGVLEGRSPIIVRGKIVAIQEAKKGQTRADDLADIEITKIFKNELKDVPLKVGGKFTVRMISLGNTLKESTDLNYPLKTDAVWLIELNTKGEFRIDGHPDRKRDPVAKLVLDGRLKTKDVKIGAEPDDGKVTKANWIKRVEDDAKREAEEREKYEAEKRDIGEIAAEVAVALSTPVAGDFIDELLAETDRSARIRHHHDVPRVFLPGAFDVAIQLGLGVDPDLRRAPRSGSR